MDPLWLALDGFLCRPSASVYKQMESAVNALGAFSDGKS